MKRETTALTPAPIPRKTVIKILVTGAELPMAATAYSAFFAKRPTTITSVV